MASIKGGAKRVRGSGTRSIKGKGTSYPSKGSSKVKQTQGPGHGRSKP